MARIKYHNKETDKWEYADSAYNLSLLLVHIAILASLIE